MGMNFSLPGDSMTSTDEDGYFETERVVPGEYTVMASRDGSVLPTEIPVEIHPGANTIEIPLAGGVIEGRVVEAGSGKPLKGMRVSIEKAADGNRPRGAMMVMMNVDEDDEGGGTVMTQVGGEGGESKTDADGKFTLRDLPAGKYKVLAKGNTTYASGDSGALEIAKDEHKTGIEIKLLEGGSIRGKVLDASGNSAGIHFLVLTGSKGERVKMQATAMDGTFKLDAIPAGKYQLTTAGPDADKNEAVEVTVRAGQTTDCELKLK